MIPMLGAWLNHYNPGMFGDVHPYPSLFSKVFCWASAEWFMPCVALAPYGFWAWCWPCCWRGGGMMMAGGEKTYLLAMGHGGFVANGHGGIEDPYHWCPHWVPMSKSKRDSTQRGLDIVWMRRLASINTNYIFKSKFKRRWNSQPPDQ